MSLNTDGVDSSQALPNHGAGIGIMSLPCPSIQMAIRREIYTTNAIESLNSVIRKSIRNRKIFNHDDSAFKIVFLSIEAASKKMDHANTKLATSNESVYTPQGGVLNRVTLHEDRLKDYV
jgi:putative transposase